MQGQSNEADWRAELIRAVSTMLASEWHWLRSELTTIMAAHVALDPDPLTDHLEQLLKQQVRVLEPMFGWWEGFLRGWLRTLCSVSGC